VNQPWHNPYFKNFQRWRERCLFWAHGERGRMTAMAKELGVRRQTLWRWLNQEWSNFPGWAAVAANCYYHAHIGKADDQRLRELQKAGQRLELRPLKRPPVVSPQADNPDPALVTGSADNDEELVEADW
jgi:hypothetical protein